MKGLPWIFVGSPFLLIIKGWFVDKLCLWHEFLTSGLADSRPSVMNSPPGVANFRPGVLNSSPDAANSSP